MAEETKGNEETKGDTPETLSMRDEQEKIEPFGFPTPDDKELLVNNYLTLVKNTDKLTNIIIDNVRYLYDLDSFKKILQLFKHINVKNDINKYLNITNRLKRIMNPTDKKPLTVYGIFYNELISGWPIVYDRLDNKSLLIYNDNFQEYVTMSLNMYSSGNGPLRQFRSDINIRDDTNGQILSIAKMNKDKCYVLGIPTGLHPVDGYAPQIPEFNKLTEVINTNIQGIKMAIIMIINFIQHLDIDKLYFYSSTQSYTLAWRTFPKCEYLEQTFIKTLEKYFAITKKIISCGKHSNIQDSNIVIIENFE